MYVNNNNPTSLTVYVNNNAMSIRVNTDNTTMPSSTHDNNNRTVELPVNTITENVWDEIRPKASQIPVLYGLAKVHKDNIPLRPILPSPRSVTHNPSNFLAKILKQLP